MGRVEDAMRRAANEGGASAVVAVPAEDDVQLSVDSEFPIERLAPSTNGVVRPHEEPELALTTAPAGPPRLIETMDGQLKGRVVADPQMPVTSREQYRRLAATLHHGQLDHGLGVIMVASAVAGEGKTLTAVNLALTFSESYRRRVLLIDADLRRPSVHSVFQIDDEKGLSDGLLGLEGEAFALRQVSERLTVLPGGQPTSDPMAGLTSGRMKRLVSEARDQFDWVIIDTPPIGLMTDASLLAGMADGVILVVKAGATSYQLMQRAVASIGKERLLGTVLNRADDHHLNHHYYYSYYYGGRTEEKTLSKRWLGWFKRSNA